MNGYMKPIFEEVSIMELKDFKNPILGIWQTMVSAVVGIFTNQPKDRFATVIPISGTLEQPNAALFETLANMLKNAFLKAFEPGFEKKEKSS